MIFPKPIFLAFLSFINTKNMLVKNKKYFLGEMDIRIAGKYKLGRKIGGGSFGDIYLGNYSFYS